MEAIADLLFARLAVVFAYGPTQTAVVPLSPSGLSPPSWMTSLPGMGHPFVGPWSPDAPGPGPTMSQQSFTLFGGSWKITVSVVWAATTSGVMDPQSWLMSVNGSVARK